MASDGAIFVDLAAAPYRTDMPEAVLANYSPAFRARDVILVTIIIFIIIVGIARIILRRRPVLADRSAYCSAYLSMGLGNRGLQSKSCKQSETTRNETLVHHKHSTKSTPALANVLLWHSFS